MTKRAFMIVVGLFLFGALLALVALNSFFQENLRLLQENNRLKSLNKILTEENNLFRRQVPPVPKGAVIERIWLEPDPETVRSGSPKYLIKVTVKNPTSREISSVRGFVYVQGLGPGARLDYLALATPFVAPGERRLFVSNPVSLGAPGTTVQILASLWQQPGVAKLFFRLPELKPPAAPGPEEEQPAGWQQGTGNGSQKDNTP